jgi:hypothetical protein
MSVFDPIDPKTVSIAALKRRSSQLFAAAERGEDPAGPVRAGWYRCFLCRRESRKGVPEQEARAEYERRFPGHEPYDPGSLYLLCDECKPDRRGRPGCAAVTAPPPEQLKFTDPISGRECELVIPENGAVYPGAAQPKIGVRHPGCGWLADLAIEYDAFFCPACNFNGRASGAWAARMIKKRVA